MGDILVFIIIFGILGLLVYLVISGANSSKKLYDKIDDYEARALETYDYEGLKKLLDEYDELKKYTDRHSHPYLLRAALNVLGRLEMIAHYERKKK